MEAVDNVFIAHNFDLIVTGISVAAAILLGSIVFFNKSKSVTNKAFFWFSIAALLWGISNYLNYQFSSPSVILWVLRFHLFISLLYSFSLFSLFYVFPKECVIFSRAFKYILSPIVIIVSLLTLTPLVFSRLIEVAPAGQVSNPERNFGIVIFAILATFLVFGGLFIIFRKFILTKGLERAQVVYLLVGAFITFSLHISFNLVLPVFFGRLDFIPFGSIFSFPLLSLTAYAIIRHRLLDVKVVATEIVVFLLVAATLFQLVVADTVSARILNFGVFCLVLAFSILLIRSVRKEVQQRERLEVVTKELQTVNKKLTELDHLKSEFLNFASHQVKAPMNIVKGYATLISDGTSGPVSDVVKETAEKIRAAADRLIALVNNLLDLGKIEEGKMDFNFEEIDVVKLVSEMVEEYAILGKEKHLEVLFESFIPSFKLQADQQKLRQVVQNVIDNALKYTKEGFVKTELYEEGDALIVKISDSGRGMSKDLRDKLFGRFVRDEKTKREIQGTGLGLYIAKSIVEAHHGSIWAESEGEGKGSQFYIKIATY
ncbi:MAG: hypothetical protein COU08_01365 [Candidatus Harrisonbacteria bacterium CG10_big_fil_rev_8_21_14_0_10_42_17]|uniref:histidine kinase n=1 Tax=Candidatus Harrisonbacteria bacterium CG10_big_fil_rev_8_21_14_0_10_42_17 TaxID=1974584 RepID=A0A2M6WIM0_9BACT|nr:MAG: hypothetical protein COU08_01365 [Candidatus Harrisonbacteria bacterium CG10_big_fil_rev_8_21_14_0_10_42_17]